MDNAHLFFGMHEECPIDCDVRQAQYERMD